MIDDGFENTQQQTILWCAVRIVPSVNSNVRTY